MPYCHECQLDAEVTARCAGSNCRVGICPLCYEDDGLCLECRAEEARGIWQRPSCPPAADVVAYLGGATVAGERLPSAREALCHRTRTEAASCDWVEIDEVNP